MANPVCDENGLRVLDQFDSWDSGRTRIWPDLDPSEQPDVVTVFEKLR